MELPEESLNKMFAPFQKYTEPKETEKYLWNQVITLQEQLEKCWSTNFEISQNLKSSYTAENFNVTTKYVALQEKHQDLYQKIRTLESELENFKIVSTTDIEKLTSQLENSIKKQKEEGKTSISEIQEQIENENFDHNQRVQQLYNELDLAQAATALQQDEVETELCKELVDINVKIRQMQKINVDVLSEIESLKCRQQKALMENQNLRTLLYTTEKDNFQIDQLITDNRQQQSNSIKVVANFPQNIQISHKEENTASLQYSKTIQNIPNKKKQNNVIATKYQPLSVSETKLNYTINKNKNLDSTNSSKKPRKDECIKASSKIRQSRRGNLAQDSHLEGDGDQNSHKKRRLFDPDDLDYLNNIEISQT